MNPIEIKVKVGVDSDGLLAAVKAWLVKKVESGEAVYSEAFCDEAMNYTESIMGDFIKTETYTVALK